MASETGNGSSRAAPKRPEEGEQELLAERDFLLRSLDDLERERAEHDIDDETYTRLRDDYTARAAAVLRALRRGDTRTVVDGDRSGRRASTGRIVAIGAAVVAFAVVAGVLLARAVGERTPGGSATGNQQLADDAEASASASEQLTELEAAVEADAEDPIAHLELARFLAAEDPARALMEYDEVVALDPTNAEAHAYGGWIVHLAGIPDEALERIDRAIAADPEFADAHFFRGMVLYQGLGDPDAAVVEFDRYLELAPDAAFTDQVRQVRDRAAQEVANQGSNP